MIALLLAVMLTGQEPPLVRTWKQVRAAGTCPDVRRVRTLTFRANGRYELYFNSKIETIREEENDYSFDPATGALRLGGHRGKARIIGSELVIEGMLFDAEAQPRPVPAPQRRLTRAEMRAGCISIFR